jgi:hypothetical protein
LLDIQEPQVAAVGAGLWAILSPAGKTSAGLVGEVEPGLSGVDVALGAGVVGNHGGLVEDYFSFGLEGLAMRSWPGWSAHLPTDESLLGVRAFAFGFAFRLSAGVLWPVGRAGPHRAVPLGGFAFGFL